MIQPDRVSSEFKQTERRSARLLSEPATRTDIRALGLDLGAKRIGVAGCDRTGLIATGLTTIENRSHDWVIAQLQTIVKERDVDRLIVGLPYTLDGELGKQAKRVQKMARRLSKALTLPVDYVDERLTSVAAQEMVETEGSARRARQAKRSGVIDRKAAAIILQQWLNERR